MKRLQRSALLLRVVTLAGCGYSLVGRGSNLPPEVRRVLLMPLENATASSVPSSPARARSKRATVGLWRRE